MTAAIDGELRKATSLLGEVSSNWKPPLDLSISQWSDQFRWLSPESSAEPGPWHTDRFPPLRGMMDAVTDPDVSEIGFRKCSQIGYTEGLINIIGRYIHLDPCPMLMVQPTLEMGEAWSQDRLAPAIRDTRVLRERVAAPGSRSGGNKQLYKKYPGGQLTISGANSAASLASRPIRIVLYDEIDRFPASAGTEGDPIEIGDKRTSNFWNSKRIAGGTPTVEGESRVDKEFRRGDQRYFYVPCPNCAHEWTLEWGHVKWDNRDPRTARIECPECHTHISDDDREDLVAAGDWRATKPFRGIATFHINALYAPWVTLPELVSEFLEAKDDAELLQVFVNTRLAESFNRALGDAEAMDAEALKQRADNDGIELWQVPDWAVLVTAGVDTQDDRLAVELWAWGPEKRCRMIFWEELYGDPQEDHVWEDLDQIIERSMRHPDGYDLQVMCYAIDSGGHRTQSVYEYVRRAGGKAMAIKGANNSHAPPLGRPTSQDVTFGGQIIKGGVKLWPVGGHVIRDTLAACLAVEKPGPRYVEFPAGLPDTFFDQMTGEVRTTKYKAGVPYSAWERKRAHQPTEAWVCFVYAYAAALRCGYARMDLDALLKRRREGHNRPKPRAENQGARVTDRTAGNKKRRRSKKSSFV